MNQVDSKLLSLWGGCLGGCLTHRGEACSTREGLDPFHTHTHTGEAQRLAVIYHHQSDHETSAFATGSVTYVSKCSSAPVPPQSASGSVACGKNPGKVFGPCHSLPGSLISPAVADAGGRVRGWGACSILRSQRLTLTTNGSSVPQFQAQESHSV